MQESADIFISKSGDSSLDFIDQLVKYCYPEVQFTWENKWRDIATSTSYYEVWALQFEFMNTRNVMLALFTGEELNEFGQPLGLSLGMRQEQQYHIWKGKPYIFCGTTEKGYQIAKRKARFFLNDHPCSLVYLLNASNEDAFNRIKSLCIKLNSVPIPIIEDVFDPKEVAVSEITVVKRNRDGWEALNLDEVPFDFYLQVHVGSILLTQYIGKFQTTSKSNVGFKYDIIKSIPTKGKVRIEYTFQERCVGYIRLMWDHRNLNDNDLEYLLNNYGSQLLHFDFICGYQQAY